VKEGRVSVAVMPSGAKERTKEKPKKNARASNQECETNEIQRKKAVENINRFRYTNYTS